MRFSRKPVVNSVAGDTVAITLRHTRVPKEFAALVLKRTERYGYVNNGETKTQPLLHVRDIQTGEEHNLDMSFVTAIIKRAAHQEKLPVNVYRQTGKDKPYSCSPTCEKRGVWTGELADLAAFVLERSTAPVPQVVSIEKLEKLYAMQACPGQIDWNRRAGYTVKMKVFKPWVERNISKITVTASSRHRSRTQLNTEVANDYWREFDADMRREFDEQDRMDEIDDRRLEAIDEARMSSLYDGVEA